MGKLAGISFLGIQNIPPRLARAGTRAGSAAADQLITDPLSHLGYFTEWGGRSWERLVRVGIVDYLGADLSGLHILDFGARYGRMSCLMALLGAQVTGVDVREEGLTRARAEARRCGVSQRIEFVRYDGNTETLPQRAYDVVFSKSVLVLLRDRSATIGGLKRTLKNGGRIVVIENGLGNAALRLARRIRHRGKWDYTNARYFTADDSALLRREFHIERTARSYIPPIYLFCGTKPRSPKECNGSIRIKTRLREVSPKTLQPVANQST